MSSLKQKLNQTETLNLENESKIAELDRNIHQLKTRNESLLEQIGSLNAQIENCNRTEIELKSDIEHQKGTNQALKYENEVKHEKKNKYMVILQTNFILIRN
jgi:hypothetical protein